jgi:hypothetical protein
MIPTATENPRARRKFAHLRRDASLRLRERLRAHEFDAQQREAAADEM